MRRLTMLLLIGLSLLAFSPLVSPAQELALSVAISMKEATEELGRRFQESRSGVRLRYNFGASGALQQQIEAGAPVDLFISAGDAQMGALEWKGLLRPGSRRTFARNALVAVVPADAPRAPGQPADLLRVDIRRIAIGNPKTVPAGQYAEESLRSLALWDAVRSKLVYGENVRQVLEYVARGEVEAGIGSSRSTAGPSTSCRPERISRPDRKTFRKDSMASPSVRIQADSRARPRCETRPSA